MSRALILVATLTLTSPFAGMAQSATQTASAAMPAPTHDLRAMMKNAHSTTEYKQIAGYLHQREMDYRAKAEVEKIERDRRAQINAGLVQKYPRPVDYAEYLYTSYVYEADHAAIQARHFDELAAAPGNSQQIASDSHGKS